MTLQPLSEVAPVRQLAAGAGGDRSVPELADVVRVYIAAPGASAREARALGLALRAFQCPSLRVVSRWVFRCLDHPNDPSGYEERSAVLANNVIDLAWADVVIALLHRVSSRSTLGDVVWALAHDTPVVWIANDAEGRNIWDAHGLVVRVNTRDPFASIATIADALRDALELVVPPFEPSCRGWRGGAPPGEATRPRTQGEEPRGTADNSMRQAQEENAEWKIRSVT